MAGGYEPTLQLHKKGENVSLYIYVYIYIFIYIYIYIYVYIYLDILYIYIYIYICIYIHPPSPLIKSCMGVPCDILQYFTNTVLSLL